MFYITKIFNFLKNVRKLLERDLAKKKKSESDKFFY